jgi:hypothetical protein
MSDHLLNIAKKLKALAERGEGGEKLNAERMLCKLMEKHGISYDMLEEESLSYRYFKVPAHLRKVYINIVYQVVNYKRKWDLYSVKNKKNEYAVLLTFAEEIEVRALLKFYADAFQKELEVFTRAFIHANKIFPTAEDPNRSEKPDELTDEDLRVLKMAEAVKEHEYQKRLGQ